MFGCSGACFNGAVDCQTRLSLFRSQPSFHGDLLFVCECASVCSGGRYCMCVEILAPTCAVLLYTSKLTWVCAEVSVPKPWLASMGLFCRLQDSFCSCQHMHLCASAETFAGPVRALRNRMELIATMRNDKTFPLPMIVRRGKTTLTSQAASAGFSCSLVLTSSLVTAVQTVQGSGCSNSLMTWTVSRGTGRQTDRLAGTVRHVGIDLVRWHVVLMEALCC